MERSYGLPTKSLDVSLCFYGERKKQKILWYSVLSMLSYNLGTALHTFCLCSVVLVEFKCDDGQAFMLR